MQVPQKASQPPLWTLRTPGVEPWAAMYKTRLPRSHHARVARGGPRGEGEACSFPVCR